MLHEPNQFSIPRLVGGLSILAATLLPSAAVADRARPERLLHDDFDRAHHLGLAAKELQRRPVALRDGRGRQQGHGDQRQTANQAGGGEYSGFVQHPGHNAGLA